MCRCDDDDDLTDLDSKIGKKPKGLKTLRIRKNKVI